MAPPVGALVPPLPGALLPSLPLLGALLPSLPLPGAFLMVRGAVSSGTRRTNRVCRPTC